MHSTTVTRFGAVSLTLLGTFGVQGRSVALAAATPGADTDETSQLQEIIVSGQKRDELLIDTPVVTEVFSDKTIEEAGIQQPSDFLRLTPNVNFYTAENPGDFLINIRGLSSVRTAEPSVALIIDGVPVASAAEFNSALFDLQQIEVLKGPQGAYWGRDASAGAIVITTKAPGDTYSGQATVDYGNFNTINANASFGGPIAEGIKFRFAVSESDTDGPYTDVNTGEKVDRLQELIARARVEWDVTDALKLDFRVTGGAGLGGALPYTPDIGISAVTPTGTLVHGDPVTQAGSNINFQGIPYTSDVKSHYRRDLFTASLKGDYELPFATLTSITAYSRTNEWYGAKNLPYSDYLDPSTNLGLWAVIFGDKTQNYQNDNYSVNQEIRLTSKGDGPVQWQAGFQYVSTQQYFVTDAALNGFVPTGLTETQLDGYDGFTNGVRSLIGNGYSVPAPLVINGLNSPYASTNYDQSTFGGQDYAPFASVDYKWTDQLTLRLAGRYDSERRTVGNITPNVPNPFRDGTSYNNCIAAEGVAACNAGEAQTFQEFQPKITIDYKIPDFGSVYTSWGRGFKTGGFNTEGTRAEVVAAFTSLYLGEGQTATQAAANANAAVVAQDYYKKEVDDTFEAGFKSSLFNGRLYMEGAAFYTDVHNAQTYTFDPVSNVQAIESIDKEEIYGIDYDFTAKLTNTLSAYGGIGWIHSRIIELGFAPADIGHTPPYAAEFTGNAGLQYVQPLQDGLNFVGRIDYQVTGPTWFDVANTPGTERSPYGLVDLRLGVATDHYEFTLWSKNLFSTPYLTDNFPITSTIDAMSKGWPRTFGLEVRAKF